MWAFRQGCCQLVHALAQLQESASPPVAHGAGVMASAAEQRDPPLLRQNLAQLRMSELLHYATNMDGVCSDALDTAAEGARPKQAVIEIIVRARVCAQAAFGVICVRVCALVRCKRLPLQTTRTTKIPLLPMCQGDGSLCTNLARRSGWHRGCS